MKQISWDEGLGWGDGRCKETVTNFRQEFKDVFTYKRELDEEALRGRVIWSLFGRGHRYDDPEDVAMKAFNTQIQASASDLLLDAAAHLHEWLKARDPRAGIRLVVHDEVIAEAPEEIADEAGRIFANYIRAFRLKNSYGRIPLDVEGKVGDRWDKE